MKFFFFSLLFSIFYSTLLFAQNPTPNSGFEDWTTITFPTQYEVPNSWDQLNDETNFIGILTCIKTSDAHSGSFAVKLVTKVVTILSITDTANGIISTGHLVTVPPYGVSGGLPYNLRPDSITGWFKYTPTPGDSCQIEFDLRGSNNDTIGKALFKCGTTVANYTRFSAPVIYYSTGIPDTSLWLISSSNGFNSLPNSTLYVDDLALIMPTGIPEIKLGETIELVNTLVQDQLIIRNDKLQHGIFMLYNTDGKPVKQLNFTNSKEILDVNDVANGLYFFSAVDHHGTSLGSGKLVIQH